MEEKSIGEQISDLWISLVETKGDSVGIHTKDCILWKAEGHKNCAGCPTELGCSKVSALMIASLRSQLYQPKDFDDFERIHTRVQEKIDKILHCKTPKEIKAAM